MPEAVLVAAVALAGAIAAAATTTRRPLLALGILFVLASTSRVNLETPVGTMRLEQPAIAAVALVLVATGRWRRLLQVDRAAVVLAAGFATYLVVLALSSALMAPHPLDSLRLVAWLAVSMAGAAVAFVLASPEPDDAVVPFAVGGALKGAIGIGSAILFLVAGNAIGIQEPDGIFPRVHAFTWEANLYASLLAICVPFTLEVARRGDRRRGLLLLALVLIGIPLGMTRGAYLGLVAGLVIYAVIRLGAERQRADLLRLGGATAVLLLVGFIASPLLLPNLVERATGVDVIGDILPGTSSSPAGSPGGGPVGSGGPAETPTPIGMPLPSLRPYPDTISFRLERVPIAFDDLRQSPIIGLGAESYGQRHVDSSQAGAPDHIAIFAVAALYDAGILGAAGLAFGFAVLLSMLWRSALAAGRLGDTRRVGGSAAFAASIVTMLVCYEATNALHFAINWLIIGAGLAVASARRGNTPQPAESAIR